jgi:hypothetical protein
MGRHIRIGVNARNNAAIGGMPVQAANRSSAMASIDA